MESWQIVSAGQKLHAQLLLLPTELAQMELSRVAPVSQNLLMEMSAQCSVPMDSIPVRLQHHAGAESWIQQSLAILTSHVRLVQLSMDLQLQLDWETNHAELASPPLPVVVCALWHVPMGTGPSQKQQHARMESLQLVSAGWSHRAPLLLSPTLLE